MRKVYNPDNVRLSKVLIAALRTFSENSTLINILLYEDITTEQKQEHLLHLSHWMCINTKGLGLEIGTRSCQQVDEYVEVCE